MVRSVLVAIASKPVVVVPYDREALPTSTDRAVGVPKLVANDLAAFEIVVTIQDLENEVTIDDLEGTGHQR